MHFSSLTILAIAGTALSHGIISSPVPRAPGASSLSYCGPAVTNNIKADNTSHVEGLPEAAANDTLYRADRCNLWLCRGLQLRDNINNVQKWTTGQKVPIEVFLRIKHVGSANVSIVDVRSNKIVKGGENLAYWPSGYADEAVPVTPANQTKFDVTIPDLGGACKVAGHCTLQWWWYGVKALQTYESCVDFKIVDPLIPTLPTIKSRFFNV